MLKGKYINFSFRLIKFSSTSSPQKGEGPIKSLIDGPLFKTIR